MKDKIVYFETDSKKYPICFNLNVMEEIQEEYGSLSKWGEVVTGEKGSEPNIKDLKKGLLIMINEAIDIQNEKTDEKQEFLTSKQVGRIISAVGIQKAIMQIKELANESTKTDDDGKNE